MIEHAAVGDWLNAGSTVVVAVFAVVQVVLMIRDRWEKERVAYNVVWAEWNRLMQIDQHWAKEDLIKLAEHEVLNPQEALPSDWALLSQHLAQLGSDAARYGGSAHTFSATAARNARMLIYLTKLKPEPARNDKERAALSSLASTIQSNLHQSSLLLEDAMSVGPSWLQKQKVNLGTPQSELGKALVVAFKKQDELEKNKRTRGRRLLGFFRR